MTSLLDHIRKVNDESRSHVRQPKELDHYWELDDGTRVLYEYSDTVIRRGGDERKNKDGNVYFVPIEHLPEFDYHDDTIDVNEDFWDWMDGFVERYGLKTIREQRARAVVKASDWGFGDSWGKDKKYLSDWWGGSKYFSDYQGDEARRLAVALQAVKSTVRVVDSHSRRLSVELADREYWQATTEDGTHQGPTSLTDFAGRRIIVSAVALVDKELEQGEGIDITTGFALHEASHGEYTEDVMPALEQPTRLSPLGVAGHLLNVVEDVRIESLTSEKFPGFAGYFEKTSAYMWEKFMAPMAPDAWGPQLIDKLNAVTSIVKWPTQYEPIARQDPILSDEFDWWNSWRDRYMDHSLKPREAMTEAMARLAEDPQTQKEMEEQGKQEQQMRLDQKELEEALRRAIASLGDQLMKPCSSLTEGHPTGLEEGVDNELVQRINQMTKQEFREDVVINQQFPHGTGAPGSIVVMRPMEDAQSNRIYRTPNASLVQRMKSSFMMRPSAMEWTDRLQKNGSVDEDEIWRAGANDLRFFEKKTIESAPDTSIAILVDGSGSMGGSKLKAAADTASIIHACVKDMRGVRVRVYSHTGDCGDCGEGNAMVYRIWEQGEPVSRLGTIQTQQQGDNYDGYALGWVVQELMKHSKPEEQQIVFIISDGLPNGYGAGGWRSGREGYGGQGAIEHIRSVVTWAERNGVDVIQIAIDPSIRPEEQSQMYKHWLPYQDPNTLPQQVMNILKKLI